MKDYERAELEIVELDADVIMTSQMNMSDTP